MTKLHFIPGTRRCLGVALLVALLVLAACGGDDESATGDGGSGSKRLAALEEQRKTFQEYIVAQAKKDRERGGSLTSEVSGPQYTLAKSNASENELEIVRWMADCTARTYLNPNLPKEVVDREIAESERRMWEALEAGQYSSFEAYIGMAFSFCQARIVEENEK